MKDDGDDPYVCSEVSAFISKTPGKVRWTRSTLQAGLRPVDLKVCCWWPNELRRVDPLKICQYVVDMASMIARTPWARLSSNAKDLEVVVQLAPHRKRWCVANPVMGPCNVNTGVTTFGSRISIRVYRMEDYAKVSLFHSFFFVLDISLFMRMWIGGHS
jgi:hypothetical protein